MVNNDSKYLLLYLKCLRKSEETKGLPHLQQRFGQISIEHLMEYDLKLKHFVKIVYFSVKSSSETGLL